MNVLVRWKCLFIYINQVYEAQEEGWWLGRFMTLSSGLHFTDSFDSSDPLTGIGKDTGVLRPADCPDEHLGDIRTCRVFILLESMCATKQARESLRQFRDEYISSCGDGWTQWLSEEYRRRWRLGNRTCSKGEVRRPAKKRI